MPRLNATGDALMGVGGLVGNISVNGSVPAVLTTVEGGSWRWKTSGIIAGRADTGSGYGLYQVTLPNTLAALEPTPNAASDFGAGGGNWAAWRLVGPPAGVSTSVTDFGPLPNAGIGDVDFDGNFILVQNRAEGRGIITYDPTGTRMASWDVQISYPSQRSRDDLVAYATTGGLWLIRNITTGASVPIANQSAVVSAMVPVMVGTTVYVLEQRDADITFRPATSGTGWTIAAAPAYNSDVILLSPGVVRIAWSVTPGEGPTQLRMMDLSLATGGNTLWSTSSGSLVDSTGPTNVAQAFPVGPIQGGDGTGYIGLPKRDEPLVGKDGKATQTAYYLLDNLRRNATSPIDASRITGILPPEHGGTGTGTGTDILIAENLIGTVPQAAKWRQYDISSTGSVNNAFYDNADFLRCANASALTLTGLLAGVPGQRLAIVATDDDVTIVNASGSSTAANQVLTFTGADVTLLASEGALLEYDGTSACWRLLFVSAAASPPASGSWIPLVDGAEPPVFITDGAGVLILVAGP